MTNPDWLKTAARRSAQEAWTLGQVFERYRELKSRSEEGLAVELGCSLEVLHWLSLCRRPTGEAFTEQVSAIAKRFAVQSIRLIAVLRCVEVMDALSARQELLLLAARDRSHDDETSS